MQLVELQQQGLAAMLAGKAKELQDVELEMAVVFDCMSEIEETFGADIL